MWFYFLSFSDTVCMFFCSSLTCKQWNSINILDCAIRPSSFRNNPNHSVYHTAGISHSAAAAGKNKYSSTVGRKLLPVGGGERETDPFIQNQNSCKDATITMLKKSTIMLSRVLRWVGRAIRMEERLRSFLNSNHLVHIFSPQFAVLKKMF